ncbi:TPA: tetratricopeptide repeat protein, partial [Haemophilus influenzae]
KTLLTTALLGASVFSFQSTAWADTPEQQFQQGSTAYEQSDYQTAFKLWLPMAEQGDANVQFNLGVMYAKGQGVKQDDFEAVKWFRKAAEQGHAKAQAILGFSYLLGERGVQVNKSLAKEWFGKACDNGNQDGCEYYGKLNRGGF